MKFHVNHGHIDSLRLNSFRLKSCYLIVYLETFGILFCLTFMRRLDAILKSIPDDPLVNCLDYLLGTTCGTNLVMIWLNRLVEQKKVSNIFVLSYRPLEFTIPDYITSQRNCLCTYTYQIQNVLPFIELFPNWSYLSF